MTSSREKQGRSALRWLASLFTAIAIINCALLSISFPMYLYGPLAIFFAAAAVGCWWFLFTDNLAIADSHNKSHRSASWLFPLLGGLIMAVIPIVEFRVLIEGDLSSIFGQGIAFLVVLTAATAVACLLLAFFPRHPLALKALQFGLIGFGVTGVIAFLAGFFGPMVITPGANQGPLLGILITGPLGAALGLIAGVLVGALRYRSL